MTACSHRGLPGHRRSCPASVSILWDSLGHMDLMGDMEETFKIGIGTADVLDFSSYEKNGDSGHTA